uniref:ShKL13 n=1 Tax=Colubraria reticulata TaxID=604273 RepID=A0A481SMJ7_9CAEN|nr:ShKL13 [Colubraria reticulata]
MRAVLAACCLFAVYLLFRHGDAKAPGAAAPPPPPGAAAPPPPPDDDEGNAETTSDQCVDKNENCGHWTNHCETSQYVIRNCNDTCKVCEGGLETVPPA